MAILKNLTTGRETAIRHPALIGRSPSAQVRLHGTGASMEHASVRWAGAEWILRDLGSLNGTKINDRKLVDRESALVSGDEIVFGDPTERWSWTDSSPPAARAISDGGVAQEADGNLLVISDDEGPGASIYLNEGKWELDQGGTTKTVTDGDSILLGMQRYRLELPDFSPGLDRTHSLEQDRRIAQASIEFLVNQNEEEVDLRITAEGRRYDLKSRAYHYVLLVLARLRLSDLASGLPEDEAGWTYSEQLAQQLGESPEKVNVDIHRIRLALAKLRIVDDAFKIVERRPTSNQRRIGTAKITVVKRAEKSKLGL